MSDWQVGDLAVCVDAGLRIYGGRPSIAIGHLVEGRTYKVGGIAVRDTKTWGPVHCLLLADRRHPGYASDRFRKIRPDEHEACEEEFRILLKLSKQRVSA